jgi:hypothetical protein
MSIKSKFDFYSLFGKSSMMKIIHVSDFFVFGGRLVGIGGSNGEEGGQDEKLE